MAQCTLVTMVVNSTILPGVHIGNHVVVKAGTVVSKDIPDYAIAYGNLCKYIINKEVTRMAQNNDKIISMKFDEPFYRKMADQKYRMQDFNKAVEYYKKCLICHHKILILN